MRQISDRLRDLLKLHAAKFIQQKGKYDGKRKFQNTFDHTDRQCITDQSRCIITGKESLKILQSDPWASPDSLLKGIILKGENRTCHRHITDQCIIDDAGKQHQIQRPVTHQSFLQRLFLRLVFFRLSNTCCFHRFPPSLFDEVIIRSSLFSHNGHFFSRQWKNLH